MKGKKLKSEDVFLVRERGIRMERMVKKLEMLMKTEKRTRVVKGGEAIDLGGEFLVPVGGTSIALFVDAVQS